MTSASSPEPPPGAPVEDAPVEGAPVEGAPATPAPGSRSAPTDAAAGAPGSLEARLRQRIREVPDFPRPGVLFRDITPLLRAPDDFAAAIEALTLPFAGQDLSLVAGIESRGFLFAAPAASRLGVGLVPLRKPGKLPGATVRRGYRLEYGEDALEMHRDAVAPGDRVLLVDDVIATGGSAAAAAALLSARGARVVGGSFLIELAALGGRERVRSGERRENSAAPVIHTVLRYP